MQTHSTSAKNHAIELVVLKRGIIQINRLSSYKKGKKQGSLKNGRYYAAM